jgi:hypothetical protein
MNRTACFLLIFLLISLSGISQSVAVLKYKGGGDWYSNPTALPNLVRYCNDNIDTNINEQIDTVEPSNVDLFQYPFLHMTGHGNVFFSEEDARNLRTYLLSGGFLHIDDNYGMKPYIVKELKKIFPEKELVNIPNEHPLFSKAFEFSKGLPKIHEHDGKAPEAKGIFF